MKVIISKKGDMDHPRTPHSHVRLETDTSDDRLIVRDVHQTDVDVLWNGEAPAGLPIMGITRLPDPIVPPTSNVSGATSTIAISNVSSYALYPTAVFTWTYPDTSTSTGVTGSYTFPAYPSNETITVVVTTDDHTSNVVSVNASTLPDPTILMPDIGSILSFQNIEGETHVLHVNNTQDLANLSNALVHWKNLTSGVKVTGMAHTYVYPAHPNVTQFEVWTTATVSGNTYESSRHTVTYTTLLNAIIGPITKTLVSGTECTTGASAVLSVGGAVSTTGDTIVYTAYDISSGVSITPISWSEGDNVTLSVDYTPAQGDDCEFSVRAVDGNNPDLEQAFTGNTITYVSTLNINNLVKTLQSGHSCSGNGSGVFLIDGATTTTANAISHSISAVTTGMFLSPTSWVQGSNVTISIAGIVSVGDSMSFKDTISDGVTTIEKIYTCTVASIISLSLANMIKTKISGMDCIANGTGVFTIDGATTPSGNAITYTLISATAGVTVSPTTWAEGDQITIGVPISFAVGDAVDIVVAASDVVETSQKTFSCNVTATNVTVSVTNMAKTLLTGSDCVGNSAGTFQIDGATTTTANTILYTMVSVSAGTTVSPITWVEDATITISNDITVGLTDVISIVVAASDGVTSIEKAFTCTVGSVYEPIITNNFINDIVAGAGCTVGYTGIYTVDGAVPNNGGTIEYSVYSAPTGVTILPESWVDGEEISITVADSVVAGTPLSIIFDITSGADNVLKTITCTPAAPVDGFIIPNAVVERSQVGFHDGGDPPSQAPMNRAGGNHRRRDDGNYANYNIQSYNVAWELVGITSPTGAPITCVLHAVSGTTHLGDDHHVQHNPTTFNGTTHASYDPYSITDVHYMHFAEGMLEPGYLDFCEYSSHSYAIRYMIEFSDGINSHKRSFSRYGPYYSVDLTSARWHDALDVGIYEFTIGTTYTVRLANVNMGPIQGNEDIYLQFTDSAHVALGNDALREHVTVVYPATSDGEYWRDGEYIQITVGAGYTDVNLMSRISLYTGTSQPTNHYFAVGVVNPVPDTASLTLTEGSNIVWDATQSEFYSMAENGTTTPTYDYAYAGNGNGLEVVFTVAGGTPTTTPIDLVNSTGSLSFTSTGVTQGSTVTLSYRVQTVGGGVLSDILTKTIKLYRKVELYDIATGLFPANVLPFTSYTFKMRFGGPSDTIRTLSVSSYGYGGSIASTSDYGVTETHEGKIDTANFTNDVTKTIGLPYAIYTGESHHSIPFICNCGGGAYGTNVKVLKPSTYTTDATALTVTGLPSTLTRGTVYTFTITGGTAVAHGTTVIPHYIIDADLSDPVTNWLGQGLYADSKFGYEGQTFTLKPSIYAPTGAKVMTIRVGNVWDQDFDNFSAGGTHTMNFTLI